MMEYAGAKIVYSQKAKPRLSPVCGTQTVFPCALPVCVPQTGVFWAASGSHCQQAGFRLSGTYCFSHLNSLQS